MHSTDPEVVELNDQRLQAAFNDPVQVNSIVAYLRLVTSAYLKVSRVACMYAMLLAHVLLLTRSSTTQDNADDFTPFLFTLEDEFGGDGNPPSMDEFRSNQVEAIGKEADHVQIAALSSCLKVS